MPQVDDAVIFPFPDHEGVAAGIQFHLLADAIPQHIWGATPDGELDYKNLQGRRFFGIQPSEPPLGATWTDLVHPDDRARATARWRQALASGDRYECEMRLRQSDGAYIWHLAQAIPFRNEHGRILRWFGTNTDISKQKAAEEDLRQNLVDLERSRRSLSESHRELELFATLASHDLQAPLRSMRVALSAIHQDPNDHDAIRLAERGVQRMESLLSTLMAVSRISSAPERREWVDLAETVAEVKEMLAADIKSTHATLHTEGTLPPVWGDPAQLREVFQNIISNALRYTGGAPPLIRIHASSTAEEATISIEDKGIGFPQSQAERAFDLFARLPGSKGTEGSGAGLAICRRIIRRHGGRIFARSSPGLGTTIVFTLPIPPDARARER